MLDKLKSMLVIWMHELETNEHGMAHMADNRVFCLKQQINEYWLKVFNK